MSIRRRADNTGWERGELGKYIDHPRVTRRGNSGWTDAGKETSPEGQGAYSPDDDMSLRQGTEAQFAWASRDIFDDVNANSRPRGDDNFGFDATGPIKAGVNKKQ
jgi:hypothetical protein